MTKTEKFEAMAVIHIDLIYNFVLHALGREYDAQILVQEIYIKAYKYFDDFVDETDCKLWLLKITKDALTKFVLSKKNCTHTSSISDNQSNTRTSDKVSRNETSEIDSEDYVAKAIYSMPIKYRMIVILADIEKFSYSDISYVIGCPVKIVASRLQTSRQILKRKLQSCFDCYDYKENQSFQQDMLNC
jgi:RNA polymerase sigma-70 factor (ECF subfamily)